jgi:hypothetical protein
MRSRIARTVRVVVDVCGDAFASSTDFQAIARRRGRPRRRNAERVLGRPCCLRGGQVRYLKGVREIRLPSLCDGSRTRLWHHPARRHIDPVASLCGRESEQQANHQCSIGPRVAGRSQRIRHTDTRAVRSQLFHKRRLPMQRPLNRERGVRRGWPPWTEKNGQVSKRKRARLLCLAPEESSSARRKAESGGRVEGLDGVVRNRVVGWRS